MQQHYGGVLVLSKLNLTLLESQMFKNLQTALQIRALNHGPRMLRD